MRILYLPIIEPGAHHEKALKNKRGLWDALLRAGHDVLQYDYLASADIASDVLHDIETIQPDLLLTQLHGADRVTPDMLVLFRATNPDMKIVNWSGDSWRHGLLGEGMLALCKHFDLQLIAAPDILPEYEALGIRAHFWQIAYEYPVGDLPDVPAYDVVFLGNVISEPRRKLLEMLRTLPYKVGIYGDWEHADGNCLYDFAYGEALYKKAKLAIADAAYPDARNYISNRPFQIAMAHGALLLHQHVDRMAELTDGWQAKGYHYLEWQTIDDLKAIIEQGILPLWDDAIHTGYRQGAIDRIYAHASTHHTYDCRVQELMEWLT